MRDYSYMCKTCTCDVCECLDQTNCPIEQMKTKRRSKIAQFVGNLFGGLMFKTPFPFFVMIWLG